MCGEGADELFFGYDKIFRWASQAKNFDIKEFSKYYSYGTEEDLEIVEDAVAPFRQYKTPIGIVASFFKLLISMACYVVSTILPCFVQLRLEFHLLIIA